MRWKTIICICLLAALPCAGLAQQTYGTAVIYNAFDPDLLLELFEADSYESAVLGRYRVGATVTLLSDPAYTLVKVRVGHTEGYMLSGYLIYDESRIAQLPPVPMRLLTITPPEAEDASVSLHQDPDADALVLGRYPAGRQVTLIGEAGTWKHVSVDGIYGYVQSSCLADAGTEMVMPGARLTQRTTAPPVRGEPRAYTTHQRLPVRGYTVDASVTETHQNTFAIQIALTYPGHWTVSDDIISYSLYINGEKVKNVPQVRAAGQSPASFATTFTYADPITSMEIAPNWGNHPEDRSEQVAFVVHSADP